MSYQDLRNASKQVQSHVRRQAINLHLQGENSKAISRVTGASYKAVLNWIKAYKAKGEQMLEADTRGRAQGEGRKLNAEQESKLRALITDRMPDQLKLPFALWTRKAVQELVYQQWRVKLSIRTVGDYFKRWGFTPQKPAKQAYERCTKAVQKWLDEQYPALVDRAKKAGGTVYWADEAGVKNSCQHGRSYSPKGKTPIRKTTGKQLKINMISAISNQGHMSFMTYAGSMNAKRLIEFLSRLVESSKGKAFVVVDNLRVHHARKVRAWLAEHRDLIELHYLPAYAPDLNPDEYLNCDLKNSVANAPAPRTQHEFNQTVGSKLRSIQRQPTRIKKYFEAESIKYAAA